MRPAMIRSNVVLPQPLGPRMTSVLPSGMRRLTLSMANAAPAAPRHAWRRPPGPADPDAATRAPSRSVLPTSKRSILAMVRCELSLHRPTRQRHRPGAPAETSPITPRDCDTLRADAPARQLQLETPRLWPGSS